MKVPTISALLAAGFFAVAGSASAADLLTEVQMDKISAGADISTTLNASASATWDVTTNADHDVTVDATVNATNDATVVVDASSVGTSSATSSLAITVNNN